MSSNLNRRDFLKIAATVLLAGHNLPSLKAVNPRETRNKVESDQPPNILILVFDALSANNMSLYGYPRQTTPNIERFANNATVFHRHYSGGSFTPSGTASILTGVYPWLHRSLHSRGRPKDTYAEKNIFALLPSNYHSLAYTHNNLVTQLLDLFRTHIQTFPKPDVTGLTPGSIAEKWLWKDFNTAYRGESTLLGYYHQPASLLLSSAWDKFSKLRTRKVVADQYGDIFPRGVPQTGDHMFFLLETAINWTIEQLQHTPNPYLAYIHYWPPHDPFRTRKDFIDCFLDQWAPLAKPEHKFSQGIPEELLLEKRRHYDEYIAYIDAEFGRLYETMLKSGLLENCLIILTSDHGEMFERGIYGHLTSGLFDPVIHIPLIIRKPQQNQREDVHIPTSAIDILPTALSILGEPLPEWLEGRILPTFDTRTETRDIFAMDSKHLAKNAPWDRGSVAIIREPYKLVQYSGYEGLEDWYEMYNMVNDPEELDDRVDVETDVAKDLKEALATKIDQVNE